METEHDAALAARLRRLDTPSPQLPFDYDGLVRRHASRTARRQRRQRLARSVAGVLVVAVVGASVWRLGPAELPPTEMPPAAVAADGSATPRIVRAESYLALAALEDHIASVDDALTVARMTKPGDADVARLERVRDELLDSYAQVRYAERVSASF